MKKANLRRKMNQKLLICIVGIDGSGKTTQARKLLDHYKAMGVKAAYAHCYHRPILLKPFKMLAKATVMRNTNEFSEYKNYRVKKTSVSRRYHLLAGIYTFIWFLDYWIQTFIQIKFKGATSSVIIIDRYIYDTALNISLSLNKPVDHAFRLIDFFLRFNKKPDHLFVIDLPEETAFNRKNDIQSVAYLKERREHYLCIAKRYGAHILNGEMNPESLENQIFGSLKIERTAEAGAR